MPSTVRKSSIQISRPGECQYRLSMYRDDKRLSNKEGAFNLITFCRGWEIYESIDLHTMECEFIFEDAAGLMGSLTGTEVFKLEIQSFPVDKTYYFRSYGIYDRIRAGQTNEVYFVKCYSDEFIKNESINVFGNSEVIFNNQSKAENIIETLVKDKNYLGSNKRLFTEETLNEHSFIAPNWRPFDVIPWVLLRTIRKSQKGGSLQNGFVFFENSLGFHAKSYDKMIEDIEKQRENTTTNPTTGEVKMYQYVHDIKNTESPIDNQFLIDSVVFPDEATTMRNLRHGIYSGYSVGFDPVSITSSKMGLSKDMSSTAYTYNLEQIWPRMAHLNAGKSVNPLTHVDKTMREHMYHPKRIRYCGLPNQSFDPKFQNNPQASYEQLAELQAYRYIRRETLNHINLKIVVPGNLDLYVGSGIDIIVPSIAKSGGGYGRNSSVDRKYSGRYLIKTLTHSITQDKLRTEVELMKDSILR